MSLEQREKIKKQILLGNYVEAEREFYRAKQTEATNEWQSFLTEVAESDEARAIARTLKETYGYRVMRKRAVPIVTLTGDRIAIPSWYALKLGKKKGKAKKGPNGRGDHLLLRYWGFMGKQSLNYASRLARQGVSCQSYDLAAQECRAQGVSVSAPSVNNATQTFGDIALAHRDRIALVPEETFNNKRIIVAIDGGRVRTREKKPGRYAKDQKRAQFTTAWREPKLLVIAELDEQGKYRKGTKPIYEATMNNHDEVFYLLYQLARGTHLNEAKEIILSGDGAQWIWEKFSWLSNNLGITGKTTEILDFYHATEHLTAIAEANTALSARERAAWFQTLKTLLRAGRFEDLKTSIEKESQTKRVPALMNLFQYFERNRDRIRYDVYEKNHQPIGSGIVESAVRRVINLKLKSPSIFWNIHNLERVLHLRCILMAGRWNIMVNNMLKVIQLKTR